MIVVLWLVLLVVSWPLALLAVLVYPVAWLLLLPFRLVGISVNGSTSCAPSSHCRVS